MAQKYAKGSRAWGICGRSGKKTLLREMVFDGRFPNLRVDPDWWEDKHPQEFLPKVEDPTALYRPSPEVIAGPTTPVNTASQVSGTVTVTWTPADSGITEIASYSVYKGIDGAVPTLLITCNVRRDFLGGIIGVQNCTTVPSIPRDDTSSGSVYDKPTNEDAPVTYLDTAVSLGHTYCYYVVANPMGNNQSVAQGPPSAPSNTSCVTMVLPTATTPVLSEQLQNPNVALTWTAATVGAGAVITNYQVWRNLNGGSFSLLTTVGNVLAYLDTATTPGDTNQYFVIAVPNFGANSASSNIVTQIIPTDPFYDNVVLMLHFDGTNGSTAMVDSSKYAHAMAAAGAATLSTVTPKFGTASFNQPDTVTGTGSKVLTPITQGSELDILSDVNGQPAPFTIDGWFFLTTASAANLVIFDYGGDQSAFNQNHQIVIRATTASLVADTSAQENGGIQFWGPVSGVATISTGVWHHFAVVRDATGKPYVFLDGVSLVNANHVWVDYKFPATSFAAVGYTASISGGLAPGRVDELRVTNGIARWTTNFTPPAAPTVP